MKICIPENLSQEVSGKHKFLGRLVRVFKENGVEMVDNNADILLHIGRNTSGKKAQKKIMRVDGLILNKAQDFKKKNGKLLKYICRSDAIIYQGDFCEQAYKNFLGVRKKNVCIHNGADPKEFGSREIKNYYFAYCNWRPHKRMKAICKGFIRAVNQGLDSKLVIAGEVKSKNVICHPNVKYVGRISSDKIRYYLSHAIATIHLSWLDWCPNSMVESIVAGCPVIYSDSGGSAEIGCFGGISIKDVQWNFKPTFLYKPPNLNCKEIADAFISAKESPIKPDSTRLHINIIAQEYLNFFHEVLN